MSAVPSCPAHSRTAPALRCWHLQAIAFSAASSSQFGNKNWNIVGNLISGVNTAFEVRGGLSLPVWSMTGMNIQKNSITADYRCSALYPCWNVYNDSPAGGTNQVPVANNWVSSCFCFCSTKLQ